MATRDWYTAEGLTEATTTSATVWTTQVTLNFTPIASTAYVIFWTAAMQLNSLTDDGQARLYDVTNATQLVLQNLESQENATPIDYPTVGGMYFLAAGSAIPRSFAIQFKSETAAVTTKMKNARLVALELTSNDAWGESIADSLTSSSTAVEKLRVDITVPVGGGTYAIFAGYNAYASSGTNTGGRTLYQDNALVYTRNGGSQFSADWLTLKDVTNRTGHVWMYKKTWTAGAHDARLKHGTDGGATDTGTAEARILILRLDDGIFGENHYGQVIDCNEGVAGSTTYTDRASVSEAFVAGNFLVFGSGVAGVDGSTTVSGYGQIIIDSAGTPIILNEGIREMSISASPTQSIMACAVVPFTAASHSLAFQNKLESAGNSLWLGAVIAVKLPSRTAREAYQVEALTEQSTTSNSAWTTQATLTFTPSANKNYALFWSAALQLTVTTSDGQADLYDVTSGTELVLQNMAAQEIAAPIDYPGVGGQYFHKAPMLLLHMEGTDEAQVFKDSSPYLRTITALGNAKTDSAQFKFGSTSAAFDGTGDYLTIPDSADLELGTSDFTVSLWFRTSTVAGGFHTIFSKDDPAFTITHSATDLRLYCYDGTTTFINGVSLGTIAIDTWYHVAVTRQGTIFRGFFNGTLAYTSGALSNSIANLTNPWCVGSHDGFELFTGWIDELSIEIGVARWTAAFTPPTQPYGSESRSWAIRFKSEVSGVTTKMKSARLVAIELTDDDVTSESLAISTTTNNSTSTVTRVTANITVPTGGGTYLIVESCHLWDNVPSGNMSAMRFKVDGTVQFPGPAGETSATWIVRSPSDNTQRTPGIVFNTETFTAGAHTVLLTYDTGGSSGTTGIEQARILMVRLDDGRFGEYFYNELGFTDVAGSTTYTSKASISNTFAGGDYLLLGGLMYSQSSTANSAYAQMLLDNSTTLIETVNEVISFQYFSRSNCWLADVATLSAGTHSLAAQQKNETGTANFQASGAVLAIKVAEVAAEYGFYMGFGIV